MPCVENRGQLQVPCSSPVHGDDVSLPGVSAADLGVPGKGNEGRRVQTQDLKGAKTQGALKEGSSSFGPAVPDTNGAKGGLGSPVAFSPQTGQGLGPAAPLGKESKSVSPGVQQSSQKVMGFSTSVVVEMGVRSLGPQGSAEKGGVRLSPLAQPAQRAQNSEPQTPDGQGSKGLGSVAHDGRGSKDDVTVGQGAKTLTPVEQDLTGFRVSESTLLAGKSIQSNNKGKVFITYSISVSVFSLFIFHPL